MLLICGIVELDLSFIMFKYGFNEFLFLFFCLRDMYGLLEGLMYSLKMVFLCIKVLL